MRSFILLSLLLASVLSEPQSIVDEYFAAVDRFSKDGRTLMSGNPSSLKAHFLAFKDYKNTVDEINADPGCPFKAEMNKFCIMTEEERSMFGASYNTSYTEAVPRELDLSEEPSFLTSPDTPAFVNWATRGAVGPVKDQNDKKCRSAWATVSTAELESSYFLATGELVSFSDQEILECALPSYTYGCRRGTLLHAAQWVQRSGHLASSEELPYKGKVGGVNCQWVSSMYPNAFTKAKVNGLKPVTGEANVLSALVQGPLSAAVKTPQSFYAYKSGIYSDMARCSYIGGGHPVMLIGYGMKGNTPYWRIQNSWGTDWGEDGLMLMSRSVPNNCGITSYTHVSSMSCKPGSDCKPPIFDEEQKETEKGDKSVAPTCTNKSDRCEGYSCKGLDYDNTKSMHRMLFVNCKEYCGWCDVDSVCEDKYSKCNSIHDVHAKYCESTDPALKNWMAKNCKDTCGGCHQKKKDGECSDREGYTYTQCQTYKRKHCKKDSPRFKWMMENCAYTCGFCEENWEEKQQEKEKEREEKERREKEERERKEMENNCRDLKSAYKCTTFKEMGDCRTGHKYYEWMNTNCKKTCGWCPGEEEKEEEKKEEKEEEKEEKIVECIDKNRSCSSYKKHCNESSKFYKFMTRNCKKTCGWC